MEEITSSPTPHDNNPTNSRIGTPVLERRARPQKEQNLNCPRCNSTNTKFCYYNNYSLTQPRYFCKTCRRYWTQGGSLRNVPVGGGSRKNKRSSSAVATASTMLASTPPPSSVTTTTSHSLHNKLVPDLNPPSSLTHLLTTASQNPNIKFLEGQDLNLAFPIQGMFGHHMDQQHHHLLKMEGNNTNNNENHEPSSVNINGNVSSTAAATCTTTATTCGSGNNSAPLSALELLRTGIASRGGLNSYLPMPMTDSNTLYPSGFPNLQEFKPSMNFFSSPGDLNHDSHNNSSNNMVGSGDNNNDNVGGRDARLLFPFADMNKLASSTTTNHHDIDHQSNKGRNDHQQHNHQGPNPGYWTGMLGGGTW